MTRPTLSDLSPRYQAQVAAQLASVKHPRTVRIEPAGEILRAKPTKPKARLRQDSRGMNKTETAFHDWLKSNVGDQLVYAQAITLRIGNGCRYTPDFIVHSPILDCTYAYEVKGFMRDDAAVKLKVAATTYPWIQFFLVTRDKTTDTSWNIQRILP